jgi:arylsulfatase A-like enzyme
VLRILIAAVAMLWAAAASAKPNFVVVMTDDMSVPMLEHMPLTRAAVGNAGVTFSRAFVTTPLCCPARASFLTGKFANHHGVLTNSRAGVWGWQMFADHGNEQENLGIWLQRAGYRTALIGKYLNGYGKASSPLYVPPGWSHWFAGSEGFHTQFNYVMNRNGVAVSYGSAPEDYGGDVMTREAIDFIGQPDERPFFAFLAYSAPHTPRIPAPRHAAMFSSASAPRTPDFCEADLNDKPAFLSRWTCSASQQRALDARWRAALRSLQAVDEGVSLIMLTLAARGLLDDTYVIFMSDHGQHFGNHRQFDGKDLPYDIDIHIPLMIRGPGIAAGRTETRMVLGTDLAPTILELAGTTVPATVDGRTLKQVLRGQTTHEPWRTAFPLMRWRGDNHESNLNRDFIGVRTARWKYIEWAGGIAEMYDLQADPYELNSIANVPAFAGIQAKLADLATRLNACVGAACRVIERESAL